MLITFLPDVLNKELLIKPISRKSVFVQMVTFKKRKIINMKHKTYCVTKTQCGISFWKKILG